MSFKKGYVREELEDEFIIDRSLPTFTKAELETFGEELNQHREVKTVTRGEEKQVSVINFWEAARAFGAVKKTMHIGVPTYSVLLKPIDFGKYGEPTKYQFPTMMDLFENKYEQWLAMVSKKEFATKKRDEWFEGMAEMGAIPA